MWGNEQILSGVKKKKETQKTKTTQTNRIVEDHDSRTFIQPCLACFELSAFSVQ